MRELMADPFERNFAAGVLRSVFAVPLYGPERRASPRPAFVKRWTEMPNNDTPEAVNMKMAAPPERPRKQAWRR